MPQKFVADPTESWQIPMTLKRNDQSWSKDKKTCPSLILFAMAFFSLFNSRVCRSIWCFSFCSSSRNFSLLWSFACTPSGYTSGDCMADLKRPVENSADSKLSTNKNPSMCCQVWKKIFPHAILISPSLPVFRSHTFSCHSPKRWFDVGHWPTDSSMSRFPSQDTPLGGWLCHSRGHANHNPIRNTCNAPCGLSVCVTTVATMCKIQIQPHPYWSVKKLMLKLCNLTSHWNSPMFMLHWFSVLPLQ